MSCFDVVYQSPSPPYSEYLTCHRSSFSNSPLKKRCRLDPEAVPVITSASTPSSSDVIHCKRPRHAFKATTTTRTTTATTTTTTAEATETTGLNLEKHASNASNFKQSMYSAERSVFPSAHPPPHPPPLMTSTSTSPTISSTSVATSLKNEMTSAVTSANDDEMRPVTRQQIGGNSILLTYFSEDIETNIDKHFHRALNLSQRSAAASQRFAATLAAAGSSNETHISSCCRQNTSPLSHRNLTSSFWNTMPPCPASASSAYHHHHHHHHHRPSTRSIAWSPLMASPPKPDTLALAFTVPADPIDPYDHHLNFPSAAAAAASSPAAGVLGALHHPQDSWHAYAFAPPPPPHPPLPHPPPAPPSTYRRYRHSVHEFSFSEGVPPPPPCPPSAGSVGQFAAVSGMRGYKSSFLHGHAGGSTGRADEPKPSHADFWRSRCYGVGEMPTSHLAAGFTLPGGIEVTQTNLPESSVKDVYWF